MIQQAKQNWDPESFRALTRSHAQCEVVRWWKATKDPSAPDNPDKPKYLRTEVTGISGYRALIQQANSQKHHIPYGEIDAGTMVITTMPDELPFSYDDWIVPIGDGTIIPAGMFASKTMLAKDLMTRGSTKVKLAGTISSSGTAITGTGTTFLTDLMVGDIILVGSNPFKVAGVGSDTSATLTTIPSPVLNGNTYVKAIDELIFTPAAAISTINTQSTVYKVGMDFNLAADEQTVQWLTPSGPAYGERYYVEYRYLPKFVVQRDNAFNRHVVSGVGTPQRVIARLWKPETLRNG